MVFLISQNIDNLHLKSGIREDLIGELHGNMTLARCPQCGKTIKQTWDRPVRCSCDGLFQSSIIEFGEELPREVLDKSINQTKLADLFMAIGSSLFTQPARILPIIAKRNGAKVVIVNRGVTTLDRMADIRFSESAGEVLSAIVNYLESI